MHRDKNPYPPPPSRPTSTIRQITWSQLRDGILFLVGIFILVHETLFSSGDHPYLLVAGLACAGAPLAIRADQALHK